MCMVKLKGDMTASYFLFLALLRDAFFLLSFLLLTLGKPPSISIEMLNCCVALTKTRLKLYACRLRSSKLTFKGRVRKGGI